MAEPVKLTEAESDIWWRLKQNGSQRFAASADHAICRTLEGYGFIEDWGAGSVRITPKGDLHLRRNSEPF